MFAEAQSGGPIEAAFHLDALSAQSSAHLVTRKAPALALPAHGMIRADRARLADAENLLQVLRMLQLPMSLVGLSGLHRKALLAEGPERGNPLDVQFPQGATELRARRFAAQLPQTRCSMALGIFRFEGFPRSRCTTPRSPSARTRVNKRCTCRPLSRRRRAASTCLRWPCSMSCRIFNRSRALNAIRSCSIVPPGTQKSGHSYFAQCGHSHVAPKRLKIFLDTFAIWVLMACLTCRNKCKMCVLSDRFKGEYYVFC